MNPNLHRSRSKVLRNIDVDESAAADIAFPCAIRKMIVSNSNAAIRYLKIYDLATAATVGTTVPKMTIPLQATSTYTLDFGEDGYLLEAGLSLGATTGVADADTGAPGANEVVVNVLYE